jgi:integrase
VSSQKKRGPVHTGIETRHQPKCRSRCQEDCDCHPHYRAAVHDSTIGNARKSPTFKSLAEARAWKANADLAILNGTFGKRTSLTIKEAAERWLAMAEAGEIRNRSGKAYKPSVLRSYETSLRLHVLPLIGSKKFAQVRRSDLQEVVDRIGLDRDASTVRNALMPIRAMYRRALQRDIVSDNPTEGLALPAVEGRRDRVADPAEASELLAALPEQDQAVWATAFYAGLRLGELQALGWENVEWDRDRIRVEWSWDKKVGRVEPKSRAGRRAVPIPKALRGYLEEHCKVCRWQSGLALGRSESLPFSDRSVRVRADREWNAAGLLPIGFHEARHTYASLMIAAGVNAKTLSTFMGHQSITTTLDRYGHLFPGSEAEAAALLDAYLAGE